MQKGNKKNFSGCSLKAYVNVHDVEWYSKLRYGESSILKLTLAGVSFFFRIRNHKIL